MRDRDHGVTTSPMAHREEYAAADVYCKLVYGYAKRPTR